MEVKTPQKILPEVPEGSTSLPTPGDAEATVVVEQPAASPRLRRSTRTRNPVERYVAGQ